MIGGLNVNRARKIIFITMLNFMIFSFGVAQDYNVGIESSMDKVFIKNDLRSFHGSFTDRASISLAKNEFESFQIVIKANKNLTGVRVSPSSFDGLDVEVHPVGNVKVISPTTGFGQDVLGWYPDPILTFVDRVDVKNGDYQSFWVTVHAFKGQAAGEYNGKLTVSAANSGAKDIAVKVIVWDFSIPDKPSFPTAMSWAGGEDIEQVYRGTSSWAQRESEGERYILKDEYDFLIEKYRLFPDRIYGHGLDFLEKIYREKGWIDFSNLVNGPIHLTPKNGEYYVNSSDQKLDDFMTDYIARLKRDFNALPNGMKESVYTYLLDEEPLEHFDVSKEKILKRLRQEVPQIKIMIDSFQDKIVWEFQENFVPLFDILVLWEFWPSGDGGGGINQFLKAKNFLHERGKKIYWYITDSTPREINWHYESALINTRILLGLTNFKFRPDGFLYWEIGDWIASGANDNHDPLQITQGSYCDWDPRTLGLRNNGDGTLFLPGPERIIPTIRLANFRDGMEDYEYFILLEKLKNQSSDAGLKAQAEEVLKINSDLVGSYPLEHTYSSDAVYAERAKVAELIVALGGGHFQSHDVTPPNIPSGVTVKK